MAVPTDQAHSRKTVIIGGASGGMGRTIARNLATAGYQLILIDMNREPLTELADSLTAISSMVSLVVDLTQYAQIQEQLQRVPREQVEPIVGLVNVQGLFEIEQFSDIQLESYERTMAANMGSVFFLTQASVPLLERSSKASIVNIASTAGQYGSIRPASHYAAAKGAVLGFTKSLARELAPRIRVNAISPGPVNTSMLGVTDPTSGEAVQRTLLGRLGTPEDIAHAVRFLIGVESDWVTGQVFGINGGSLL